MRIAQIAPLAESVPPKLYGGTERVVAWLTDELIDLGHEVTLFASGDSKSRAELIDVWPRALLRIAAKVPRGEKSYFSKTIAPQVDGEAVQLVGEVNDRTKEEFLSNAAALIFPIDWPEPFGLVMIEAMACGTPVIAFPCGSVPEVIEDGVTGFIVQTEADAVNAIKRLPELDRRRVRDGFERRFTARQMAQEYIRCYRMLIEQHSNPAAEKSPFLKRANEIHSASAMLPK
jgi:glycosyltransferase involved in cell wall biosynthesis